MLVEAADIAARAARIHDLISELSFLIVQHGSVDEAGPLANVTCVCGVMCGFTKSNRI